MSLSFNSRGFIKPYTKIESSVFEIEEVFVGPFPHSETRQLIFDNYLNYLDEFQRLITFNFTHWLDGSFMSKKIDPNDLDFVAFIDYRIYEQKEEQIFRIVEKYGYLKLDNFVSQIFPINHPDTPKWNIFNSIGQIYFRSLDVTPKRIFNYRAGLLKSFFKH